MNRPLRNISVLFLVLAVGCWGLWFYLHWFLNDLEMYSSVVFFILWLPAVLLLPSAAFVCSLVAMVGAWKFRKVNNTPIAILLFWVAAASVLGTICLMFVVDAFPASYVAETLMN